MEFYEIAKELKRMREIIDRAEKQYTEELMFYKSTHKDFLKETSRNNAVVIGFILGYSIERIKKDLGDGQNEREK